MSRTRALTGGRRVKEGRWRNRAGMCSPHNTFKEIKVGKLKMT